MEFDNEFDVAGHQGAKRFVYGLKRRIYHALPKWSGIIHLIAGMPPKR